MPLGVGADRRCVDEGHTLGSHEEARTCVIHAPGLVRVQQDA